MAEKAAYRVASRPSGPYLFLFLNAKYTVTKLREKSNTAGSGVRVSASFQIFASRMTLHSAGIPPLRTSSKGSLRGIEPIIGGPYNNTRGFKSCTI